MPWFDVRWNYGSDGNVEHIADHDLTPEQVEPVILDPDEEEFSRSSGLYLVKGMTPDGRRIVVIYDMLDDITVLPITAYELEE